MFFYGNRNSIDHLFTQSSCNYIFIIHTLSNVLMIDLFTDYYIISNNALDNVINFLYNLSCIICASRQWSAILQSFITILLKIIIQYFALFWVNRFIMKKKQWNLKRFIKIYLNTHGSRAHISSFILSLDRHTEHVFWSEKTTDKLLQSTETPGCCF